MFDLNDLIDDDSVQKEKKPSINDYSSSNINPRPQVMDFQLDRQQLSEIVEEKEISYNNINEDCASPQFTIRANPGISK